MSKNSNRVPKSQLVKMLDILGLKLSREEFMGRRMWKVSDGSYHASLRTVFKKYRYPKDKAQYQKISPIVENINRAIF